MLTFVGENNRLLTGGQALQGVRPLAEVLRSEFLPNLFSTLYHQSYIRQLANAGEEWIFLKNMETTLAFKICVNWLDPREKKD